MSLSTNIKITLLSSLTSLLAAALTLLAFLIDIALYAKVKHEVKNLPNIKMVTVTAAGQHIMPCYICYGDAFYI